MASNRKRSGTGGNGVSLRLVSLDEDWALLRSGAARRSAGAAFAAVDGDMIEAL